MGSHWIKIEKITVDKPEVFTMAKLLELDPDAVLGKLVRFWCWADGVTDDGKAAFGTFVLIDRLTYCPGFGKALLAVGWLRSVDDHIEIPNFEYHMGESSKKRAKDALRKQIERQNQDDNGTGQRTKSGQKADQIRLEESITPIVPKGTPKKKVKLEVGGPAFDEFWTAYPNKKKKQSAIKAFRKVGGAAILQELLSAIAAQKQGGDWKKDGGEFIPHPSTWLNNGCWEDEVINPEKKQASRPQRAIGC